jgi:hypothetical protein
MKARICTAFFPIRTAAEDACVRLCALGIARDELSILPKQVDHPSGVGIALGTKAAEGAAIGTVLGTIFCGAAGAVAAGGAILVPAFGSVLVGPIVAGLAAAGVGAAIGAVIGAAVGLRIPEYEATYLDDAIAIGGALITVRCEASSSQRIEHVLRESGGLHIRRWTVRR